MKHKKMTNTVWGIILIAVGVLAALKAFNIVSFNLFFDGWWTLFIIVPCTVGIFTEKDKTGNIIGILIGVALLLACQDVVPFDILWKLLLPAAIVVAGCKLLFKGWKKGSVEHKIPKITVEGKDKRSTCAIFTGADLHPIGEEFKGAELTAVFGGVDCDLRDAVIENDCVIEATAIFGGIDILLPSYVNVEVESTAIFGGVSTENKENSAENTVTVYVKGTAMFGGIEIK